jgi:HEAT repeat protein
MGPDAVAFLAHQMKQKDSFLRDRYVALWPKMPAFLKSRLKQPTSAAATRLKAVKALRQMGPSVTGSDIGLAALRSALEHPDIELRSIAEGALGDLGPRAKGAVPALIKCVAGSTNINGVWALGRIGPDAKAALPILESKMRQETGRERVYAAGAVWKIGGENAEARLVIKKALEDPDRHVRIDAENVLVESPEIGSR